MDQNIRWAWFFWYEIISLKMDEHGMFLVWAPRGAPRSRIFSDYTWGGAVCASLQLAHAGDAHAMNATLLMGWCGVGLCSCSFNLHTAGDAHAMHATVLMGWCGVGLCSCSFNLHTLVMHTPWMLRYSWGGVGWGCVHVPSTCTRGAWGWGWGGGGGWCC